LPAGVESGLQFCVAAWSPTPGFAPPARARPIQAVRRQRPAGSWFVNSLKAPKPGGPVCAPGCSRT